MRRLWNNELLNIKTWKCIYFQVEKYQVRYNGEEYFVDPSALLDGNFQINLKSDHSTFEARIKYHGYPNWTQWISSERSEKSALYLSKDIVSLLPLIVTSTLTVVLLCLLTICIAKRNGDGNRIFQEDFRRLHKWAVGSLSV